ncbi:MAG TPA: winged helix-turn-helix domain-containing protein [Pseudonocardiaceae bacterium]|nr:winged helix-turn-helix domain-containing protein [Pseudonocardiaceae bacterium]
MADERDDEDKRPASRRVADQLRSAIESGVYQVGEPLPPLRQLAELHHVAVNTAMAAVRILTEEGYINSKPNAANYVRDPRSVVDSEQELRRLRAELGELRSQVRQAGGNLAAIEERLSGLSEVVTRLENQTRRAK